MAHNTFYHTDLGAQQVRNTAGQLVAMLDQCLVNGGPTFSVTGITRSGATATATTTAHGLSPGSVYPVERRLTISGATQSDYNGTFLCNITSNTTFTYTVANSPTTPATGTILAQTTPLGWTIAFTATNKRSYQQGSGSNAYYLDVDDSNGGYALVRGYETMSAIATGSGLFPTVAQVPLNTFCWQKDGSAVDREWIVCGNSKVFHLFIAPTGFVSANGFAIYGFGDPISEVSGDVYQTNILGSTSTTANANTASGAVVLSAIDTTIATRYMPRLATGVGTAIQVGIHGDATKNATVSPGTGSLTYPSLNGGLYISPLVIHHNSSPRAVTPGLYDICHNKPLTHLDYFSGNGVYAGKRFQAINVRASTGAQGQVALEVSAW